MSALPPDQIRTMREISRRAADPVASMSSRWRDMHQQANDLAELAGLAHEPFGGAIARFDKGVTGLPQRESELVWQAIEDVDAMLEPGMRALVKISQRGQDVTAPALALWREYYNARAAILRLARIDPAADQISA